MVLASVTRSSVFSLIAVLTALSSAWAEDAPEVEDSGAIDEILVSGEYPGPGLWKVMNGEGTDAHVLWIVADPPPLPKDVKWKSSEIERIVRGSQEILLTGTVEVQPDEKIGFFKGMSLLPLAFGWRKNPDGATLQDVLPADLYERWRAEKRKYLRRNRGVERWRPVFAAEKLRTKAFAKNDLREGGLVWDVVSRIAEANGIETTTPALHFTFAVKNIKKTVRRFMEEDIDDVECFTTTLDLVRAIADDPTMNARASAWATADLVSFAEIPPLPNPHEACSKALLASSVAREFIPDNLGEQIDALWISEAERTLAENTSTFAILPLSELIAPDGYIATLQQKGYVVQKPTQP